VEPLSTGDPCAPESAERLKTESASVDKAGAALLIQQLNSAELARKKAKDVLETHQLAAGHD
jgi:hypothetical protein